MNQARVIELTRMSKPALVIERKRIGAAPLWEAGQPSKDELIRDILDHEANR